MLYSNDPLGAYLMVFFDPLLSSSSACLPEDCIQREDEVCVAPLTLRCHELRMLQSPRCRLRPSKVHRRCCAQHNEIAGNPHRQFRQQQHREQPEANHITDPRPIRKIVTCAMRAQDQKHINND